MRNAIDHGAAEPEAERLALGKPNRHPRLIAQQQGNRIVVELSDDGRGIDIERVKRRAARRDLHPRTRSAA